jgi:uncharacterized membrane protein YphA (DoxX/SURF4 family)
VALRVAIGWHFLTEGMAKLDPPPGKPAFSAEGYFRLANGPFGTYFRAMIPDANGVQRLRLDEQQLPVGLKDQWRLDADALIAHYGFDENQKTSAERVLAETSLTADNWFRNPENRNRVSKYLADLRRTILVERDPKAMPYERERTYKDRAKLNTERRELFAVTDAWSSDLRDKLAGIATPAQVEARGAYEPPMTELDWLNTLTTYGLIAAGACLILGFLTPLAALWAAGFLTLIYLSFPPWPGVPAAPIAEGNYWIVNKNLIELIALLVIATTPSGFWLGLDALFFGWIRRRRLRRQLVAEGLIDPSYDGDGSNGAPRRPSNDPKQPATLTRR